MGKAQVKDQRSIVRQTWQPPRLQTTGHRDRKSLSRQQTRGLEHLTRPLSLRPLLELHQMSREGHHQNRRVLLRAARGPLPLPITKLGDDAE